MQRSNRLLSDASTSAVEQQLHDFVVSNQGIKLALLASEDGFEVASYPREAIIMQRIAPMGSSLQALAETMARESGFKGTRSIMIAAEAGTIFVFGLANTQPRLALTVMATGEQLLGKLLWAARNCCSQLEAILAG